MRIEATPAATSVSSTLRSALPSTKSTRWLLWSLRANTDATPGKARTVATIPGFGGVEVHALMRRDEARQARRGFDGEQTTVVDERHAVADGFCLCHVVRGVIRIVRPSRLSSFTSVRRSHRRRP